MRWDVRGFGDSDKPPGPYCPELFATDLAALLDVLAIDRVHLGGISMGGVIAQRFALDHPGPRALAHPVQHLERDRRRGTANWQRLADAVEQRGFGAGARDASRSFAPSFAAAHPDIVAAAGQQTAQQRSRAPTPPRRGR